MGKLVYEVTDHLGNRYPTLKDMCLHYGITSYAYCHRIERGWTVEEVLIGKKHICYDHEGNEYNSLKFMCDAYISIASLALGDPRIDAISVGMGTGGERGGCPDPDARMGYGRRYAGGPGSWCTYCCLN